VSRFTSRSLKEPAMFALVAVVARLVIVVRNDRQLTTRRSHTHELDQHLAHLMRVL
jgi:hypothetical protein